MMTELKPFEVTIRVFYPQDGQVDAEHAAASTLANAASFTSKMQGGAPRPIAFRVMTVRARP